MLLGVFHVRWIAVLAVFLCCWTPCWGSESMRSVGYCYQCGLQREGGIEDTYCENAKTWAKEADKIPRHQMFNVHWGESAKHSCQQDDVGIKVACPASPFCLTVAAKVCLGTWKLGSCDKKSFWCWQKSCAGNPHDVEGLHLDYFNRPQKIPGCKVRYNVSRDDVRKILIEKAVFCLCDSDGCNTDIVDLTGRGQPHDRLSNDDVETEYVPENRPGHADIADPEEFVLESGAYSFNSRNILTVGMFILTSLFNAFIDQHSLLAYKLCRALLNFN